MRALHACIFHNLCCVYLLCSVACSNTTSSISSKKVSHHMKEATSHGYSYKYLENDPLNTRIYTLSNGLVVYLSDYKATPTIYTSIAVRAGGKFDPSTHTGLAHYLEHMLFKGTSDFGTMDWPKEKTLLDSLAHMFNEYTKLRDPEARKAFYKKIDQLSHQAATYAIPNEYDAMLASIGATGTNAYTSEDRTVYINDIPSNQLETWLIIEANRFQHLVPRLFHTELETVYEEKNRMLDSDVHTVFEKLSEQLFPTHPYGTQTVIGTIEHLKNPSITEIQKYFEKFYRPNNIAICLSGDLDYDQTIAWIDKYFGNWQPNHALNSWCSPAEAPLMQSEEADILGPEAEGVYLAYRLPGAGTPDYPKAVLVDYLLSNSQAGLIDLNLSQAQRAIDPWTYLSDNNDYSVQYLGAHPIENQSLEELKELLVAQIDLLGQGKFDDWLIQAVSNDFKKSRLSTYESNSDRCALLVDVATNPALGLADHLRLPEIISSYTKKDVTDFIRTYYKYYAVAYKRIGERKTPKVEKPEITKIPLNKGQQSDFVKNILARKPVDVAPVFIDYSRSINTLSAKEERLPIYYVRNEENDRFSLYYYSDISSRHDPKIRLALRYLDYLGPEGMHAEDFKKELFKIGCTFSTSTGDHRSFMRITGLSEHMEEALQLVERLLAAPAADKEALQKLVASIRKERANRLQDRGLIRQGLLYYGLYGSRSPFTNVLPTAEIEALRAEDLLKAIETFAHTTHRILYYGPMEGQKVAALLDTYHNIPDTFLPLKETQDFVMQEVASPQIYWTHYDMVQEEVLFFTRNAHYDPARTAATMIFNASFGQGMSAIVFRELREAQGLAYATYAAYQQAREAHDYDHFFAYIGTQADKQKEAIPAMFELLSSYPLSEQSFEIARQSIIHKINNQRIIRENILFDYEAAKRRNLNHDIRKDAYKGAQHMTIGQLKTFHKTNIKHKAYSLAVLGDRALINVKDLEQYGRVQEVLLENLFGYGVLKSSQSVTQ